MSGSGEEPQESYDGAQAPQEAPESTGIIDAAEPAEDRAADPGLSAPQQENEIVPGQPAAAAANADQPQPIDAGPTADTSYSGAAESAPAPALALEPTIEPQESVAEQVAPFSQPEPAQEFSDPPQGEADRQEIRDALPADPSQEQPEEAAAPEAVSGEQQPPEQHSDVGAPEGDEAPTTES